MSAKTKQPHAFVEESFSAKDRIDINKIIVNLKQEYETQLVSALKAFNQAQHELNRRQHEVNRLEKHLERIQDFIEKHNVTENQKEGA